MDHTVAIPDLDPHRATISERADGMWEARCPPVTGDWVAVGSCRDEALYRLRGAMVGVLAIRDHAANRPSPEDDYR